jgi:hypothetical protein
LAQELLHLAHRREELGGMSPHLQVQAGIKTTYQETPALFLTFPHLAEPIKLFYLTPTCALLGCFHLEHKN